MSVITFDIFAKDHASKTFGDVAGSADKAGGKFKKFAGAAKVVALGAVAAGAAAAVVGKKLIDAGERAGTSNARIGQVAKDNVHGIADHGLFIDNENIQRFWPIAEFGILQWIVLTNIRHRILVHAPT